MSALRSAAASLTTAIGLAALACASQSWEVTPSSKPQPLLVATAALPTSASPKPEPEPESSPSPATSVAPKRVRVPQVAWDDMSVSDGLPRKVASLAISQNFGRFRFCHGKAEMRGARADGSISVHLETGPDGAVSKAINAGSDLTDRVMVDCVMSSFELLTFPLPEGGGASIDLLMEFPPRPAPAPRDIAAP